MTALDPWSLAADLLDPPPAPHVFDLLGYRPTCLPQIEAAKHGQTIPPCGRCPQELLHALQPFEHGGPYDVLTGGGMGGGKTTSLVYDALLRACQFPGIEIWFVRATYKELTRDVLPHLQRIGNAAALGGRWNGTERVLTLKGSTIRFVHAPNVAAAADVRGECQGLYVDERTRVPPDAVDTLKLRIRSGDRAHPVIGIRSGTNPGGVGHGRVKTDFYDPAPLGLKRIPLRDDDGEPVTLPDGRALDGYFIPSTSRDNPHLDDTYLSRFGTMSPEARAAYRDGDWTQFEGMRFKTLISCVRAVDEIGELPLGGVRRGLGIDWGMRAPFAAVWGCVLNEQVIIYRELHQPGLKVSDQAKAVLAAERDGERDRARPIPTWIDPATWARSPDKPLAPPIAPDAPPPGSIAATYRANGVPVEKGFNDRVAGWSLIDELLAPLPDGRSRLLISEACPNVIRSLSNAPRSTKNPEDVDEDYTDDHAADATRYLLCGLMRKHLGARRSGRRGSGGSGGTTSGLARAKS